MPGATATTPMRSSSATAPLRCRSCATPGASSCRSPTPRARPSSTAQMIRGIKEHLFAVLRDVDLHRQRDRRHRPPRQRRPGLDHQRAVSHPAQCAGAGLQGAARTWSVCWGGHSIADGEYHYTKRVGYELGLRALDVCTGCGPGAMKGPMKGAAIAHAKQRIVHGRYIGLTEPGIIAAEPPNAIVNQLVIMPDIEKRLEAFLRLAHGIVVFPGGVGHRRGNPVPARRAARAGQRRPAAPGGAHRPARKRGRGSSSCPNSSRARWAPRRWRG